MVPKVSVKEGIADNQEHTLEHKRLGEITYRDEDIITLPQGLLGFEKRKNYVVIDREDYYPFVWMINTDDPNTSFVMVNPLLFHQEYNPNVTKRDLNEIEIDNPQSLLMYVIITLKPDASQSTANLRAPILINIAKKLGKQLVLLDDQYSTKHRILNPK
ncbi:MAG: flagellar assembly protein FliW [Calditrichaeota bacterium]|nr:MAG: flagellar assembly protein FliW [Calditrichota bacterium]